VNASEGPLRFGLVGTGYWARITHAPALASSEGIEFVAVWGRDPGAARMLAAEYGAAAYADFDEFLAAVDAVAFAVPPDVQAAMAARAAAAGRHLLLEKPIATSVAAGGALVEAVEAAQVASVVFFTLLFSPPSGPGWPRSPAAVAAGPGRTLCGWAHRCRSPARSTRRGGRTRAPCGILGHTPSHCCGRAWAR
jgi:hypothetical protein